MESNIFSATTGVKKRKVVVVNSDDYYSLSPIKPRKKTETLQTQPCFVYSPPAPNPIYLESNTQNAPCTSRSYSNFSENLHNYTRNEGSARTSDMVNFTKYPKNNPKSCSKINYTLNRAGIVDLKGKKAKENRTVQKRTTAKNAGKSKSVASTSMIFKETLPKSSYINNFASTAGTSSNIGAYPSHLNAVNEGNDNLEQAAVLDLINKRYGNDLEKHIPMFADTSANRMNPVLSYTNNMRTFIDLETSAGHNFHFPTNLTQYKQYEEQLIEQLNKESGNIPTPTTKLLDSLDNKYNFLSREELLRLPDKIFASPDKVLNTDNMSPNNVIEISDDSICDTTDNGNIYEEISSKIINLVPEEALKLKKEVIDFTEDILEFENSYKASEISRGDLKENIDGVTKETVELDICDKEPESTLVISPKPETTNAAPGTWEIVPDIFDILHTDSPATSQPIENVTGTNHSDTVNVNFSDVTFEAQNQNHNNGIQLSKISTCEDNQANVVCEQISEPEKIADAVEVTTKKINEEIVTNVTETDINEAVQGQNIVKINENGLVDTQKPIMDFNENVLLGPIDHNTESSVINNCEICPAENMCLPDDAVIITGESQNNQPLYENCAILCAEDICCQPVTVENAADLSKLHSNFDSSSGGNATTILNTDANVLQNSTVMTDSEILDLKTRIMQGTINKDEILQIIENKNIIQCSVIVEQVVQNDKLEQQKSEARHTIDCLNKKIDVMKSTFKCIEDIIVAAVKSLDGPVTEREMQSVFDNLRFVKVIVEKMFLYYDFSKPKEKKIKYKVVNITKKDPPQVARNNNKNKVAGKVKRMSKRVFSSKKLIMKALYRINRLFCTVPKPCKVGCANKKQNNMVSKLREIARKDSKGNGRPIKSESKKRKNAGLTELELESSDVNINDSSPTKVVPKRQVLGSIENTAQVNEITVDVQEVPLKCEEIIDDEMHAGLNKFNEETTSVDCSSINATNDENEDPLNSFHTSVKEADTISNLDFQNFADGIKRAQIKADKEANNAKDNRRKRNRIRKEPNMSNVRHSRYPLRVRKPPYFYSETRDLDLESISTNKEPKRVVVNSINVSKTDKCNNITDEIKDDGKACVVLYDKIGNIEKSMLENICDIYNIENEQNVVVCDDLKTEQEQLVPKKRRTNRRLPDPNLPRMTLRQRTTSTSLSNSCYNKQTQLTFSCILTPFYYVLCFYYRFGTGICFCLWRPFYILLNCYHLQFK